MNCKMAKEMILTDHIDGNLKAAALGELEEHLKICPACHALAGEVKRTAVLFKDPIRKCPPPEIWRNIRAEINRKMSGPRFIQDVVERMRYILPNLKPAAVALGAAVILLVVAAAVRFAPIGNYPEIIPQQNDIIAMISVNGDVGESESGYDIGTPAERYFL